MNLLDKVIGYFNPEAGLKRARNRTGIEVVKRHYDAAKKGGRRNAGWNWSNKSAADEVSGAANTVAAAAQDLCRNTPIGHRIKMIWASNIVGLGIRAQINATTKSSRKKANQSWDKWATSTFCDFYGTYDFYGLQWLWANTVVECGGVLIRMVVEQSDDPDMVPLRLQTFEQTMLDSTVSTPKLADNIVRDGIEFDKYGRPYGYWIKNIDPTTNIQVKNNPAIFYRKDSECIHIFRKERSGQHLGMSWLTQVATTIHKYDVLVDAKLMQDQIAACLGVFIEGASTNVGIGDRHSQIEELEPGMVQYVERDSKIHTVIPPSSQGSQQFMDIIRSDIAIGAGLAHTQLTGDYSKLNFASGRMSKIEFFQTLDYCQYQLFEPNLNQIYNWFIKLFGATNGGRVRSVTGVVWAYPPRAVVDPKDEIDALIKKVRAGFESPSGASKSLGADFEQVVEQWVIDKTVMGELPFDIDPSKFSVAGNQLNSDAAAASNSAPDTTEVE